MPINVEELNEYDLNQSMVSITNPEARGDDLGTDLKNTGDDEHGFDYVGMRSNHGSFVGASANKRDSFISRDDPYRASFKSSYREYDTTDANLWRTSPSKKFT